MRKTNVKTKWYLLLLLCLLGLPVLAADDATLDDLYGAAGELIGENNYTFLNFEADPNSSNAYGYRTKAWGTYGDLADSSWTWSDPDHQEIVMTVTGLTSTMGYDVYVLAGSRTDTDDAWGVQAGFESESYDLSTADIGSDDSLTAYNLGLYYNGSSYPYRETQSSSTAACMYGVLVGTVLPDDNGSIVVYVNDCEEIGGIRTWFDGVMVAPSTQVLNPSPANGQENLSDGDTSLSWIGGSDPNGNAVAEGYYVYFGTDEETLVCVNSDELVSTETAAYPVTLDNNTTYYWQVEGAMANGLGSVYAPGDPNNVVGPVWSFSTVYYVPRMTAITEDDAVRAGEIIEITASYESTLSSVSAVTWYLDGEAIDPDADYYSVTFTDTESVLTVDVTEATEGGYDCVATNGYGDSSLSDASTIAIRTTWTWTGGADSNSWSEAANWDQETAPELSDDVLVAGDDVVEYDGNPDDDGTEYHYYYSGYLTLEDNAQFTVPEGYRFLGGYGASTVTTISDSSKLTVGLSNYAIIAHSASSVINQTGGEYYAQVDRGFLFTDSSDISGTYNLTGGTLTVDYASTTTSASSFWYMLMGRHESDENDQFYINGGNAYFDNTDGNSGRRLYIMRSAEMTIDSGSANFTDFEKVSIGFEESGTAKVVLNDGQLNFADTPLYVGDKADGYLEINGGTVSLSATAEDQTVAMYTGYSEDGDGEVIQTAGTVQFNNLEMALGSADYDDASGLYSISGGSISEMAALTLYGNSNFEIAGSAAEAIDIQELTVEDEAAATLTVDLDASGCSLITVGSDASDTTYNSGAQLANLSIVVNTLDDYQGEEGDAYDLLWAANNGITGSDSITLVNNTDQDLELQVVDAADYGYAGGQLLQIVVSFDPSKADFNSDDKVDLEDLAIFGRAWLWQKD